MMPEPEPVDYEARWAEDTAAIERDWEAFRPIADAMIAGFEQANAEEYPPQETGGS